jgi:hypothetical protein
MAATLKSREALPALVARRTRPSPWLWWFYVKENPTDAAIVPVPERT